MKKNIKRFALILITALSAGVLFTSCDPDDVDAFAEGYRDGYYGNY